MSTEPVAQRERSNRPLLAGLVIVLLVGGGLLYLRRPWTPEPPLPMPASAPSSPVAVAAPTARAAAGEAQATPITPTFDIVRVTPEGSTVIAGRAAPGASVVVRDGEHTLGSAKADRNGEFVVVPSERLMPGGRELTLAARGSDGAEVHGLDSVVVIVPQRKLAEAESGTGLPAAGLPETRLPATGLPASGAVEHQSAAAEGSPKQETAVAVLVPHDAAPRLMQGPAAADKKEALALNTVDYDDKGDIRFSGSAKPASPVRVYVDNSPAGETSTDGAGQWIVTPPNSVAPGMHQLRVDQLGSNGRVIKRVELPFQRTVAAPEGLARGQTVVQPGQNLWRIARQSYGQGTRYTVIFLANRAQIRDPNLIYPGQVFAMPVSE